MAGLILFCLFLFIPLSKQHAIQDSLDKVVSSLDLIVDFFQSDYKNLNVDGLFGLRALEGHLEALLQKRAGGELQHLNSELVSHLQTLKNRTSTICKAAISDVKGDDLEYFKKMSFIVGSPWNVFDSLRKQVDPSKIWSNVAYQYAKTNKVKVDETTSDECMSELMGSHKAQGEPCDISERCARIMTHPGIPGYGITHQILWTMLAEKAGCKNHLEAKLYAIQRGTIASVRLELCTNNYLEMVQAVNKLHGEVTPPFQDLFLEQLFVCPSLGFYQFLDINYLPQILSWQDFSGCFGRMHQTSKDSVTGVDKALTSKFDYHNDNTGNVLFKDVDSIDLQQVINSLSAKNQAKLQRLGDMGAVEMAQQQQLGGLQGNYVQPGFKGRRLLVEKEMSDGCLAHKTGVASGALVMYLRFLCEPDAALIFNSSSRFSRSIKNIVADELKDKDPALAGGGVGEGMKAEANGKPPLMFHDKKGFFNEPVNEGRDSKLTGKKYIHGDNIGNGQLGFINHQINPPDIQGNLNRLDGMNDEDDGDKDDDDADYYAADADKGNDKEDGYDYDKENKRLARDNPDYNGPPGNNPNLQSKLKHVAIKPAQYQDHDGNGDLNENYDADDDDDDDDYDGDYVDEKGDEIAHPHINARNIGHNKNNDHAVYDQYEKSVNKEKDYKYDDDDNDDDEEEDDYEYDDENDTVDNKRLVESQAIKPVEAAKKSPQIKDKQSISDSHISQNSVSTKSAVTVFLVCFIVVLLLMYRFIRKRRIRIRFNPKYFNV